MMMHIFYKKALLVLIAFSLSQTIIAQETISKTIKKNVSITADGIFHINNKYGNVTIKGWEKNHLDIEMTINVFDKEEDEASDLLERIQPEIKILGDMIYLTSIVNEKSGNIVSRYFNKANPLKPGKNNIQIDYIINIPKNVSISIDNKYGDVIIDNFEGPINTSLQHGDMWINNNVSNATISLKFGKLKAKDISHAIIELRNAELDLKSTESMDLNSNGSVLKINKITNLELLSNKDKIDIDQVDKIEGEVKFSKLKVNTLNNILDLSMKINDLSINQIKNPNALINVDQESSDITISILGTAFKFHAYLTEGILKIPKTFENIETIMIDKGKKLREIHATYGKNPTGKVSISGYRGTIILKDSSISENN
jgi:hypothetical protein